MILVTITYWLKLCYPHRWASWRSFFDHQVVLLWRCDSTKLWATLLHQGFHHQSQVRREIESFFVILCGIFIYFLFSQIPQRAIESEGELEMWLPVMILLIDSLLFSLGGSHLLTIISTSNTVDWIHSLRKVRKMRHFLWTSLENCN